MSDSLTPLLNVGIMRNSGATFVYILITRYCAQAISRIIQALSDRVFKTIRELSYFLSIALQLTHRSIAQLFFGSILLFTLNKNKRNLSV